MIGYAGLPLFVSMPCFLMTIVAIIRITRVHKHRHDISQQLDSYSDMSSMPKFPQPVLQHLPLPLQRVVPTSPLSSQFPCSPYRSTSHIHLPLNSPTEWDGRFFESPSSRRSTLHDRNAAPSPTFPQFSRPPYYAYPKPPKTLESGFDDGLTDVSSIHFRRETMSSRKTDHFLKRETGIEVMSIGGESPVQYDGKHSSFQFF